MIKNSSLSINKFADANLQKNPLLCNSIVYFDIFYYGDSSAQQFIVTIHPFHVSIHSVMS